MTVVYVPKAFHRYIIGSRGANVKYVNATFGVLVSVPRAEENDTAVGVNGRDEDGAIAFIAEKLGFELSREELITISIELPLEDAKSILMGKLNSVQKEYGVGIKVPKSEGDTLAVQGPEAKVNELVSQWNDQLGHELSVTKQEEYSHKLDLSEEEKISESLFFGADDGDDGQDLNRFIEVLRSCRSTLDICVFTITSNRIANAIIAEHRSGAAVRIITDNHTMEAKGSDVERLAGMGIPVKIDTCDGHMHNKYAVIDNKLLLTGSFNWTVGAANANFENVMITNDETFVKDFSEAFEEMWQDEERFQFV